MIGLLLAVSCFAQQVPGQEASVALLTGAIVEGRLDLTQLGLGSGGFPVPGHLPRLNRTVEALSPGGVLVRVRHQGVKLDFPSGAELLVTPNGRVHLKSGEFTEPMGRAGLALALADGAVLRITPRVSSGKIDLVQMEVGGRQVTLWGRSRRTVEAAEGHRFRGRTLLVLGDGQVLFQPVWLGPILFLERRLCPKKDQFEFPKQAMLIIGEVLRDSLSRLVGTIPRKTVEFPQAPESAATLARIAPKLFSVGSRVQAARSPGLILFPLLGDFRLRVTVNRQTVFLGLQRSGSDVPIVEWTITGHTRLQLVRPGGGRQGRPRYYLKGLEVVVSGRELFATSQSYADERQARAALVELGAAPIGVQVETKR